jgi:hypothetical protein
MSQAAPCLGIPEERITGGQEALVGRFSLRQDSKEGIVALLYVQLQQVVAEDTAKLSKRHSRKLNQHHSRKYR